MQLPNDAFLRTYPRQAMQDCVDSRIGVIKMLKF